MRWGDEIAPRYADAIGREHDDKVSGGGDSEEALRDLFRREPEPIDPRAKEAALERLRDARDEELAVFEDRLRQDAIGAGASEREIREAQARHPEH